MNLLPTNSPGGYFDCQLSAHFPGSSAGSCRVPALYTPSTGGAPAFKPGPHVHPITDTQAVSTTWRLPFPAGSPLVLGLPRFLRHLSASSAAAIFCCAAAATTYPFGTHFRCPFSPFSYRFSRPVIRPACATARQRTPSTGGVPAFKPGPHVHPILETVLTASYLPIFPVLRPFYLVSCHFPLVLGLRHSPLVSLRCRRRKKLRGGGNKSTILPTISPLTAHPPAPRLMPNVLGQPRTMHQPPIEIPVQRLFRHDTEAGQR